ncbi:MAG TPA: C13 family peptidase, partial [Ramlibacter sp.]|nr:C13 family peptidase [Ramlibacter sp.]
MEEVPVHPEIPRPSADPAPPASLPLLTWLREGVRAGFLMRPRTGLHEPTPLQVGVLVLVLSCIEIGLGRLEVAGPATFDLRGTLAPWWSTAALLLLAWWALRQRDTPALAAPGLAAWFTLWMAALVPPNLVSQLLGIAQAQEQLPDFLVDVPWTGWALYLLLWTWTLAAMLRLFFVFGVPRHRLAALGLAFIAIFGVSAWQFQDRPWQSDVAQSTREEKPRLQLSQSVIEGQQAAMQRSISKLAPQRAGVVDVYGIVFSPFADGDVFLRESTMVANILADRFDAHDRIVHLANHASTAESHGWATPQNLERAIDAIADRMDRETDVLVVYLTSHGARDYKLAAANPPLEVEPVSPGDLRRALDKAGIRHRVIAVSACYSGGWVGPLGSDATLVMTAADADHTSYGCGQYSELTFFG